MTHCLKSIYIPIQYFLKHSSHYSRSENNDVQYISLSLNIGKMYMFYLEMYEKDIYDILERGETYSQIVKLKFYAKYIVLIYP